MGKVDGCRLWSTWLTGGRVYPDYPCPHRELINVSTTRSTPLSYCSRQAIHCTPDCGSNSTPNKAKKIVDRHSIPFQTRPYAHVSLIIITAQTTV